MGGKTKDTQEEEEKKKEEAKRGKRELKQYVPSSHCEYRVF